MILLFTDRLHTSNRSYWHYILSFYLYYTNDNIVIVMIPMILFSPPATATISKFINRIHLVA